MNPATIHSPNGIALNDRLTDSNRSRVIDFLQLDPCHQYRTHSNTSLLPCVSTYLSATEVRQVVQCLSFLALQLGDLYPHVVEQSSQIVDFSLHLFAVIDSLDEHGLVRVQRRQLVVDV